LALAGWVMCATVTSETWDADYSAGSAPNPWVIALTQGSWMLYYLPLAWLILIFPTGGHCLLDGGWFSSLCR
jgi:hypothetical protein